MINTIKDLIHELFSVGCNHKYKVIEESNVLQLDDMGYPLRLFIVECEKCGKSDQQWIDVPRSELNKLDTGERVLLTWQKR